MIQTSWTVKHTAMAASPSKALRFAWAILNDNVAITAVVVAASYLIVLILYRLFVSPLSRIPGPKLAAITSWWILYYDHRCQRTEIVTSLHAIYGPVVRIAPNEVSFTSAGAVKDIYNGSSREAGFSKGVRLVLP